MTSHMLALLLLTSTMTSRVVHCLCPWEAPGLTSWSDVNTWAPDGVPSEGSIATIRSGMSVLLDVSPPPLWGVVIEEGGQLVWGDVGGLVLKTGHVHVMGNFTVGMDTAQCRMTKPASIVLTGKRDSVEVLRITVDNVEYDIRKVIWVSPGGRLEMHGAEKRSWTKLAATIPSMHDLCATVFDFESSPYSEEGMDGLYVMVWNDDGSVFDFNVFDTATMHVRLASYIAEVPEGKVVGVVVEETLGDPSDVTLDWESVYVALESLGALRIRDVTSAAPYALVALKGQPDTRQESLEEGVYATYVDWEHHLQFSARSVLEGTKLKRDFKILNTEVTFPVITLKDDVTSWSPGDQVVVASTDFEWRQAEVKTVISCPHCDSHQVRLDSPFEYRHFGEISYGVDERAEVGLLTRSVRVEGEMEDHCYFSTDAQEDLCHKFNQDTFGGNILAFLGPLDFHVQQVELYHMGQQGVLGMYPLHYHMLGEAGAGQWLRNNTVHHSFQRCFTIHGTDYSEVSDNVCYDHLGHGLFLEDSAEQHNVIRGNLILGTRHGTLILSDRARDWCDPYPVLFCDGLASYWITHPNNIFEDNVAAGSDNSGFWFAFADKPLGPSGPVQESKPDGVKYKQTRYTPIKRFYNNVAHSNDRFGVILEGRISNGEEFRGDYAPENAFMMESSNHLDPREPNTEDGDARISWLDRTTSYRNKENNMYARGGNVFARRSTFADGPVGFYAAHSVDNTSVSVYDSLFVGETDNRGQPFTYTNKSDVYGDGPFPTHHFNRSIAHNKPEQSLTAVSFASGPVMLFNCYFDQFRDWYWNDTFTQQWGYRPLRRAGGLSFRRRNRYPSAASNGVHDMKFGYCDNEDGGNWVLNRDEIFEWHMMDGNKQTQLRDYDGSVTGQAGTQLVRGDIPFLNGPGCLYHDNWGISACPYGYAKVLFTGMSGVLLNALASKTYPVTMRRDDVIDSPFTLRGDRAIEFLTMKNRSYTVNFNGTIPRDISIKAMNMETGDVIRLGICLPEDTTQLKIRSGYVPINNDADVNYVTSMAALDDDTVGNAVFWDKTVNMVFFKLISREVRHHWQETCPGDQCLIFNIDRLDGSDVTRDCLPYTFPPYWEDQPVPPTPTMAPCTGPASKEGIGAPVVDPTPPAVLTPTCVDTAAIGTGPATGEYVGCYRDKLAARDLPHAEQFLYNSMTVQVCLDRCRNFGYQYAGLQRGVECRCGNQYGSYPQKADSDCSIACSGDPDQTCGMRQTNSVYKITN